VQHEKSKTRRLHSGLAQPKKIFEDELKRSRKNMISRALLMPCISTASKKIENRNIFSHEREKQKTLSTF